VKWECSPNGILRVDASGIATAGANVGESTLRVFVSGSDFLRRAAREIVVVPDGTYRVVGTVREDDPSATPVQGARLAVAGSDLSTSSDWEGRYRLYGVPRHAELNVTKEGYRPFTRRLELNAHVTEQIELSPAEARPQLAGAYTLRIQTAASCEGSTTPLPPELRERSYDATILQTGAQLEVRLTEPRFAVNKEGLGNRFSGRVEPTGAAFDLRHPQDFYYPYPGPTFYPDVIERLPAGTFLVTAGRVIATSGASGLSGLLTGTITNYPETFPRAISPATACYSAEHRVELIRR
jgi:hypothetical protein